METRQVQGGISKIPSCGPHESHVDHVAAHDGIIDQPHVHSGKWQCARKPCASIAPSTALRARCRRAIEGTMSVVVCALNTSRTATRPTKSASSFSFAWQTRSSTRFKCKHSTCPLPSRIQTIISLRIARFLTRQNEMTDVLAADIEVFTEEVGDPRRTTLRHMLDDVLHGESAVLWLGRCSQAAVLAWLGRTLLVITVATVVAVVVIFLGAALARAWLSWTWLASWGRRWLTGSWRSWSWLAGSWCWRWLVTSRGWSRRRWCSSRSWRVGIRCSWGWRGRRSCGCIRGARGALGWLTSFPLWSSFRRSTLTLPLAASITESSTDREVLARELLIAHSVPLLALLGEKGTERGELARGRATIVTDELTAESSSIREQGDEAWHGTDSLEGGVGDGSGESESSEGLHLE